MAPPPGHFIRHQKALCFLSVPLLFLAPQKNVLFLPAVPTSNNTPPSRPCGFRVNNGPPPTGGALRLQDAETGTLPVNMTTVRTWRLLVRDTLKRNRRPSTGVGGAKKSHVGAARGTSTFDDGWKGSNGGYARPITIHHTARRRLVGSRHRHHQHETPEGWTDAGLWWELTHVWRRETKRTRQRHRESHKGSRDKSNFDKSRRTKSHRDATLTLRPYNHAHLTTASNKESGRTGCSEKNKSGASLCSSDAVRGFSNGAPTHLYAKGERSIAP